MFQDIKFKFYAFLFQYGSNSLMMLLCFIAAISLFNYVSPKLADKIKSVFLITLTAISAFLGARILHVFIERPELLKTPDLIFTKFDGMTFNGSLLFGFITFSLGLFLFNKQERSKYWNMAAIISALSYGLMRIGCFTNGCCWGKISAVPWSLKYYNSQVMPWHGLPVHPVQLYDSLIGFFIFATLCYLNIKKEKFKLSLFPVFLFLYSIGRFFTEFYRGDSFRGENLFLDLSTSQLVSVGILTGLTLWYLSKKRVIKLISVATLAGFSLLTGCLPLAPNDNEFESVQRNEAFEIYQTFKNKNLEKKNVLFLAGDDNIQAGFSQVLKAAYRSENAPKLEDIVFWEYVKNMKDIYNVIVRIPKEKIGFGNLESGLKYMESLGQPYDLILLTHGAPNHLSTGQGGYFLSFRELEPMKGQLSNLNLVMLQSCFGESLAKDLKDAGAKYVMSYPGFNRNFFFFGFFLKYYYTGTSVKKAYVLAKENMDFQMGTLIYDQIAKILTSMSNHDFEKQGKPKITKIDYVNSLQAPILE